MAITRTNRGNSATDGDGNTTATCAYTGALTAGSVLVVTAIAWDDGNNGLTAPTDSASHTWVAAVAEQSSGGGFTNVRARTWYALNTGTTTPTVTFTGANYWFVTVDEFTGVDTTTPLDVASVAAGATSTASPASCAAGSITPVTNGAYLYSVLSPSSNNNLDATSLTVPSGFTSIAQSLAWTTSMSGAVAGLLQTTAAAINPTWTATRSGDTFNWRAYTVALRPASTSTSLTVANSAQAQASENVTLSTGTSLTVADSGQAQTSGTASLTQHQVLAVAGSGQAQASGNVTFVTGGFPASISGDGRHILDHLGQPWFMVGDAGWSAIGMLNATNRTTYLDALEAHGFNLTMVSLIENSYSTSPPRNANGDLPYSGTMFQSTPNETYWQFVDDFIDACYTRGITVLACPAYVGYVDADGVGAEAAAASNAQMQAYGEFLGARYANRPNIMWLIGGDRTSLGATLLARMNAMAVGITTYGSQLVTAHQADGSTADDVWGAYSWLEVNNSYTIDEAPSAAAATAYGQAPTRPTFGIEGLYEQERTTPHLANGARTLRYQAWGAACAGSIGHVFGNNPRWHFQALTSPSPYTYSGTWQQSLSDPSGNLDAGTEHMAVFSAFWQAVAHDDLTPDRTDTFLTAGESTGTTQAAACFSTTHAVVYTLSTSSITLDLTELSGVSSVRVRRMDPTTGSYTTVGTYSTSGSQSFAHPGNNAFGHSDWVYVLDAATVLTVADSGQGQSSGSPALTQHQVLTVQNSGQAQASGSPALTQHQVLTVDSSGQTQSSTAPTLVQHQVLTAADSAQAQTSTAPTLTQHHVLAVDSSSQAQASANVTLTVAGQLAVQDSTQAQTSGTASLTQHQVLVVQSSSQAQTSDTLTLTAAGAPTLTVANSGQAQSSTSVALTQHQVLTVDASGQAQASQSVTFGSGVFTVTAVSGPTITGPTCQLSVSGPTAILEVTP